MYEKNLPLWRFVDDCYNGVPAIKDPGRRRFYLHPFPSEQQDFSPGSPYELRCELADYDNIFRTAIDSVVGIMSRHEARIEFDREGESRTPPEVREIDIWGNRYDDRLSGLKSRLNHAQALRGRAGLLLDVAIGQDRLRPRFVIKEYEAWTLLDGEIAPSSLDGKPRLRWALLDESGEIFDPVTKSRSTLRRYRVLGLDAERWYYTVLLEGEDVDRQWKNFDLEYPEGVIYPVFKGHKLPLIPLTVCNVDRLGFDQWQTPPFIDMAYSTVNAYNVDSIYKQALVNHARPTLVLSNAKPMGRIVLGGLLELESSGSENSAEAKILETSGAGLAELGKSVETIKSDALRRTVQGLLESAGANSSGEALMLRSAAGTATIGSMDLAGARAIEEQLCFAARWAGLSEEEAGERISYRVDTSYMGDSLAINELISLLSGTAGDRGPILSRRNLYAILKKEYSELISEYEDNELQIAEENRERVTGE